MGKKRQSQGRSASTYGHSLFKQTYIIKQTVTLLFTTFIKVLLSLALILLCQKKDYWVLLVGRIQVYCLLFWFGIFVVFYWTSNEWQLLHISLLIWGFFLDNLYSSDANVLDKISNNDLGIFAPCYFMGLIWG